MGQIDVLLTVCYLVFVALYAFLNIKIKNSILDNAKGILDNIDNKDTYKANRNTMLQTLKVTRYAQRCTFASPVVSGVTAFLFVTETVNLASIIILSLSVSMLLKSNSYFHLRDLAFHIGVRNEKYGVYY